MIENRTVRIGIGVAALAAVVSAWAWTGTVDDEGGTAAGSTGDTGNAGLAELVAEAERLGRAVAEGPPAGAGGAPGRLTAEEALWALCWRTTAALNEVLVRTTRDSKIVLLGELYPRLVDTCIDDVAERAHGAPRTH